jgi:hypothetical protein
LLVKRVAWSFWLVAALGVLPAWSADLRDLQSDSWVAIDEAGRTLPDSAGTRKPARDKAVGIFYFLWHGAHGYDQHANPSDAGEGVKLPGPGDKGSPHDLTRWLARGGDPAQLGELKSFHHWGRSEYGYYLSDDEWVIRRHLRSLSDAGVDVLILDATNGFTYRDVYMNLFRIMSAMRAEGEPTPQAAFLTHFNAESAIRKLREELYDPGLYRELWFHWKGKPLLMTSAEAAAADPGLAEFFTVRKSWAWSEQAGWFGDGRHAWPWIDQYPQEFGWDTDPDQAEFISVSVAGHATRGEGRSYHNKTQAEPGDEEPYAGKFFAEQWRRALEVDPEFLMVTGWNEWVAMYFQAKEGDVMLGRPAEPGSPVFVDLYSTEYNRDVEPDDTPGGDNLYYQMVEGIRQFKGSRSAPVAGPEKSIPLEANPDHWGAVQPEFFDSSGDAGHRRHPGWGSEGLYAHALGRNDIISSKVARDKASVVFAATTRDALSPATDPGWMELFLNTDRDFTTGWSGFDLKLGPVEEFGEEDGVMRFGRAVLKFADGKWTPSGQAATGAVRGNFLEVAIPRSLFPEPQDFYFKWADQPAGEKHIRDLEKGGDTAPNRRFLYHFRVGER